MTSENWGFRIREDVLAAICGGIVNIQGMALGRLCFKTRDA
jgi:hypothetical protein